VHGNPVNLEYISEGTLTFMKKEILGIIDFYNQQKDKIVTTFIEKLKNNVAEGLCKNEEATQKLTTGKPNSGYQLCSTNSGKANAPTPNMPKAKTIAPN
jgi:hypothetical protein